MLIAKYLLFISLLPKRYNFPLGGVYMFSRLIGKEVKITLMDEELVVGELIKVDSEIGFVEVCHNLFQRDFFIPIANIKYLHENW